MSKSPKTPTTASWRTLMRRADATTNKAEATKMREQAASLRRDERKKTKALSTRHENNLMRDLGGSERAIRDFNRVKAAEAAPERDVNRTIPVWQQPNFEGKPGHGEIVGGEVAKLADTLVGLARKKGGTDAVQAELARMIATARYEGQKAADDRHMKTVKDLHEAHTDKIVCSAIAAFQMQMKEQGGLSPAVTISSYTLCRMLDALNRAGYSAEGRNKAVGN